MGQSIHNKKNTTICLRSLCIQPHERNNPKHLFKRIKRHHTFNKLPPYKFRRRLDEKFKHTWSIGAGIKLPTGKYNLEDKGKLVNPNFQTGTGSTDFLVSSIYTIRYQKIGSNFETGYKLNTTNKNAYKFGNQFYAAFQLFYWQKVKSIVLLPNAGLFYEQAQHHKDQNTIKTNTGGRALFATAGLETYIGSFTIGLTYKYPLSQQYNTDNIAEIESKDRIATTLTFNY